MAVGRVPVYHTGRNAGRSSGGTGTVSLPASVSIVEVGPRDGLQNLTQTLPTAEKIRYIRLLAASGLKSIEVTLADTVGFANPESVRRTLAACRERFPDLTYGVHFHDTRGMGIANALMAMQCGVTVLDAAAGGLGGCPFAPGASGNIATEDLVFLCEEMGVKTGVDLAHLFEASWFLQSALPGVHLPSRVLQAGLPKARGPMVG